jgi:hypothetical protein
MVETVEYCNRFPVHPRHPYAGENIVSASLRALTSIAGRARDA